MKVNKRVVALSAISGLIGSLLFLSLTTPQAHAGVVNYENVKKVVSGLAGTAAGAAATPAGPVAVAVASSTAGFTAGGIVATTTYQAMSHPAASAQVAIAVTNPGIGLVMAATHPQSVVNAVKNVFNWLFN